MNIVIAFQIFYSTSQDCCYLHSLLINVPQLHGRRRVLSSFDCHLIKPIFCDFCHPLVNIALSSNRKINFDEGLNTQSLISCFFLFVLLNDHDVSFDFMLQVLIGDVYEYYTGNTWRAVRSIILLSRCNSSISRVQVSKYCNDVRGIEIYHRFMITSAARLLTI